MTERIVSIEQLRVELRESAASAGFPPEAREIAVEQAILEFDRAQPPVRSTDVRAVNRSLNERGVYYAIHSSDLALFSESLSMASAAVKALVAPWPLVGKLATLLFKYRKKRVRLTRNMGLVLLALKEAESTGLTVQELAGVVPLAEPLTEAAVLDVLASLQKCKFTDGTDAKTFVSEENGRWRAVDV
jgi:hypothetical protein